MTLRRHFLGWERTPLDSACDFLAAWKADGAGQAFDLSSLTIITPGARVGRLLLGMLVDRAESAGLPLSPPRFSTPGEIPDVVFGPQGTPAGPIQRRLAWSRALAKTPQELDALIPHRPDVADHRSWDALASMLEAAHQELIGEGHLFSDVQGAAPNLVGDTETARWRAAAVVQAQYAEELRRIGLVDPGLAHLDALKNPTRPMNSRSVLLVGVQELSSVQRRALARSESAAATLIFAPAELADTFDEFGCICVEAWAERRVKVAEESILFAGGPGDQAVRAMETIAGLGDRFAPHQISIAAPLDEVVPRLERAAERYAGVRARPAAGMPLARTGVFQLLLAIQTFLDGESFQAFAALLRHPDMERYLLRSAGVGSLETWLKEADEYGAKHIPGGGLEGPLLGMDREGWTGLSRARDAVRRLLAPLRERPVAPDAPVRVLERIYAGRRVSRDDPAARMEIRASEFIRKAIEELAGLPRDWCPETGPAVLRLILEIAARQTVPFEGGGDVFEILGWLELPMDPAPCAIVTGVNEGVLPETFGADALLPDRLRSELGVASSRRRLARDAYLLSLVVRSRRAVLICGRSGSGGDPLLPSRLLFAAEPDEVVRRVQRFADPDKDRPRVVVPRARLTSGLKSVFPELPRGRACSGIDSMRVTSFCTFLRSPYRFYLEHALGLAEYVDQPPEIDPMAFGVLIHEVLEAFGNGDVKDSSSEITIRDRLLDHLSTLAMARFGRAPAMAVSVQLAVAGARLSEFASWQARHRSAGWHIEVAEWRPAARMAPLLGLDPAFYLRGKIDRIDRHDDGSVAILDYKTGDDPKTPRQTHGRSGAWKDLQLPLYRHLAAERNLPEDPAKLVLAYVNIPGKPGKIDMYAADWGAEELADADAKARQVAARVRDGDWFELGPEPPEDGTFAALCGTSFMGAVASQEAELEGVDEDGGEA